MRLKRILDRVIATGLGLVFLFYAYAKFSGNQFSYFPIDGRVEDAEAMAMEDGQPLAVSQHLNLNDILELGRQFVRLDGRRQANRLLRLEKFSRGLPFARAKTEKLCQY